MPARHTEQIARRIDNDEVIHTSRQQSTTQRDLPVTQSASHSKWSPAFQSSIDWLKQPSEIKATRPAAVKRAQVGRLHARYPTMRVIGGVHVLPQLQLNTCPRPLLTHAGQRR